MKIHRTSEYGEAPQDSSTSKKPKQPQDKPAGLEMQIVSGTDNG
jgi:hypothetical protein